jgi:hypothetical protein
VTFPATFVQDIAVQLTDLHDLKDPNADAVHRLLTKAFGPGTVGTKMENQGTGFWLVSLRQDVWASIVNDRGFSDEVNGVAIEIDA